MDKTEEHLPTPDWDNDDHPEMPTKVRDLFVWKSLSHPERTYPKGAFTTIATIALLLSIIFAFFQEWFLILLAWATVFLLYALSKVMPHEVEHRITTQGIISMGHTYLWSELGPFWFSDKSDHRMLHIAYRNVFGQLVFLVNKDEEPIIRDTLAQYLPFIEVWQKSTTEKITDWFGKKFPLEKIVMARHKDNSKIEPIIPSTPTSTPTSTPPVAPTS